MKRLGIFFIIIIANIFNVYSQTSDASKIARTAFQHGDYAEAVNWYKSAISLTDNSAEKASLNQSLSQAQSCAYNLSQANSLYSQGNYTRAKSLYQKLLTLNPSDPYAKQRISWCNQRIREAANRQKRNDALKAALQKGDAESIKAFLESYPNDEEKELLTFIMLDGEQTSDYLMKIVRSHHQESLSSQELIKELEHLFVQKCIAAGDAFHNAENNIAARQYYNAAILYGDCSALYKKAQCYDDMSSPQSKNLLAIAAEGESDEAREQLTKIIGTNSTLVYNKYVAKHLYDNLQNCQKDLKSMLFVYVNADLYDIDKSTIAALFPENDRESIEMLNTLKLGDLYLYQYGEILSEMNKKPLEIMLAAAEKGNTAAIKWIVDNTNDEEFKVCYSYSQLRLTDYNEYTKRRAYIKYLRGADMTPDEWKDMYFLASKSNNEELLSLVKANTITDKYFYKWLKDLLAKEIYWDEDIIKELLTFNYTIEPKRRSKVKKILSKLKTRSGLYTKESAVEYRLAMLGTYDNLHGYTPQIKHEEKLWWASPTATSTGAKRSSTATTTKSSSGKYKSSGGSTGTVATAPTYKVGQELDDGYVFYVDATGRHGKIVSKKVYSISPKNAATFKCGPDWRFASSGELYRIYKTKLFPIGNYFGTDGQNITDYVVVVFNKKSAYNSRVNWQYGYSLLLVKTF